VYNCRWCRDTKKIILLTSEVQCEECKIQQQNFEDFFTYKDGYLFCKKCTCYVDFVTNPYKYICKQCSLEFLVTDPPKECDKCKSISAIEPSLHLGSKWFCLQCDYFFE